jgi:3-dehydroquinate dehydratase II
MPTLLILLGPNLNMLGVREPEIYGTQTMTDIHEMCETAASQYGFEVDFHQSNHEGELVEWIQSAVGSDTIDGIIINAAAYTHTSVAIHDALKMVSCPVIEVHHSDPSTRESFRHISYVEPVAAKVFKGQGAKGYVLAIEALAEMHRL